MVKYRVADNSPLYGVCVYVQEIVQRPPGIPAMNATMSESLSSCSRFLVSAPRCYCILTKLPFFELRYEVLNTIIAQERLERITQFVNEMSLAEYVPSRLTVRDGENGNTDTRRASDSSDWMSCAIPVDGIFGATAIAAGLASECKLSSFSSRTSEPTSPGSAGTGETSDTTQAKQWDRELKQTADNNEDHVSETSDGCSDSFDKLNGGSANGHSIINKILSCGSSIQCVESSESLYSSIVSLDSEEDDISQVSFSGQENNFDNEGIMAWAKAHNNESLHIICGYHSLQVPPRGSEITFQPLEHLSFIKYHRPGELELKSMAGKRNTAFAAAEEASALSTWTVATVCRALSVESVLALLAGALLEKQIVVICSNLGVLSAVVLSIIPMIHPFEWHSLLLPVLPNAILDFLDAPVPYIVGIQHKTSDVKSKISNILRVNVYKNEAPSMPQSPQHKELAAALEPIHATLVSEGDSAKRNPIYKCSDVQVKAAEDFLAVLRSYLESFCPDLRSHTITDVQSNNDRVSLLLKESFVDSFPARDQPFIKLLVDTTFFCTD